MMTVEEIRTATFEKAMRGYRVEDVDAFKAQTAATVEQLTAAKQDAEQKLAVLAQKIEEYHTQEDLLKSAMLNAQRMGDNMIREARQKSDAILGEATMKAKKIITLSEERERDDKEMLRQLEDEIAGFKGNILALYQQHIESLTAIDSQVHSVHVAVFGEEKKAPEQPAEEDETAGENAEAASPIEHAENIVDSFSDTDE